MGTLLPAMEEKAKLKKEYYDDKLSETENYKQSLFEKIEKLLEFDQKRKLDQNWNNDVFNICLDILKFLESLDKLNLNRGFTK